MLATQLIPQRRGHAAHVTLPSLFDGFWAGFERPMSAFRATHPGPRIDLAETADAYELSAELPGAAEADIEVTVADGVLTVRAEKKTEAEREEPRYHLRERGHGNLERRFRLPPTADADAITAKFENGLLQVWVPKVAEAKSEVRKIAIDKA